MKSKGRDKEKERAITIYDVLDVKWFVRLVKLVAKDYDLMLSHRGLNKIRTVLRRTLPDHVYDVLADTKTFRSVKSKRIRERNIS